VAYEEGPPAASGKGLADARARRVRAQANGRPSSTLSPAASAAPLASWAGPGAGARVGGEQQRAEQQYGTMWLCSMLVEADAATPGVTA